MYNILVDIYYILGIFFVIYETKVFFNPLKNRIEIKSTSDKLKDPLVTKEEKITILKKSWKKISFHLKYLLWSVIGLFSSQYIYFLFLFLLSFLLRTFLKNKSDNQIITIIEIDAAISIFILVSVILNHFLKYFSF